MKDLVTGGTGFIGRHLVRRLLSEGRKVVLVTRSSEKALDIFPNETNLEIIEYSENGDQYDLLIQTLKKRNECFKCVFHLAANLKYLGARKKLYLDNVIFSQKLFQFSTEVEAQSFVYISSIDAVGPCLEEQLPDEDSPCNPLSDYGWSKLESEKVLLQMQVNSSSPTSLQILRLGNIYGPGSDFIIVDIARAIKSEGTDPLLEYYHEIAPCTVHLCFVDDAVDAIVMASNMMESQVFHISGKEPSQVGDLFKAVSLAMNKSIAIPLQIEGKAAQLKKRHKEFLSVKKKADRVTYFNLGPWCFSTQKAKQLLGFTAQTSLQDGIHQTLTWRSLL